MKRPFGVTLLAIIGVLEAMLWYLNRANVKKAFGLVDE